VTFEVDDLHAILGRLAADGCPLIGGAGQHEGTVKSPDPPARPFEVETWSAYV
jgi:hypothetical protein